MSDSWRIQVNEIDRSQTVLTDVGTTGAMVVRASKGPLKPVYISRGNEGRIIDLFGVPSVSYPDVWEAIEFNKEAPLWISAPNLNGLFGGVLITTTGTVALSVGLDDPDNLDFAAVECSMQIGVGDGLEDNFTATLNLLPYVNQSVEIYVDGVAQNVVPTDAEPEILAGSGSGTLTRATGALDFTFTAPPADGEVITAGWESDQSTLAYYALFSRSPMAAETGVKMTYNSDTGFWEFELWLKNHKGTWAKKDDYIGSEILNQVDGFGKNIYLPELLEDNDYLIPVMNDLAYSASVDDTANVPFGGGSRGSAITLTELTLGWNYFQQKNVYPTDIFIDPTADAGIPALFDTLRNTYQKYSSYILPLPNDSVSNTLTTKSGYSINNRGLAFYWNWGKVRDSYNNSSFWTTLVGRVGQKYAQMANVFNGLAPSWVDENSHGGQLGGNILELAYDPSEDELSQMDAAGINPIIFDPGYGVMVVSQRTAQSPNSLSDTSWIAHSRVFDYIISNTISQILVYQITKLNDETHRQLAVSKGQTLIAPILSLNLLAQGIPKCDRENNTDDVLARREFVFTWGVRVTPFAEKIILNFVYGPQGVDVEELI